MSATPRPVVPAVSGAIVGAAEVVGAAVTSSRVSSQTESTGQPATVGTVVVSLQDKPPETAETSAYEAAYAASERSFVAVLAPTASEATAFLASQPPGAHVFVREEDGALAVLVKFRQATRAVVVVKGKDWKKARGVIEWGVQPPVDGGTFKGTTPPVHRMHVPREMLSHLERCWRDFLPHVQSVVMELCCEVTFDEKSSLEDCAEILASSAPPPLLVVLAPDSCGFYMLGSELQEGSTAAYALRQVEFDFAKHYVSVSDGAFKPTALLTSTQFSTRRALDPDLTFRSLLDNFQFPERTMLKETTVSAGPACSVGAHNYIELSSSDPELELLRSVCAECEELQPLISTQLPDALLTSLDALYLHFAASYSGDRGVRKGQWTQAKAKIITRILPVWIELMAAVAIVSETSSGNTSLSGSVETRSRRQTPAHPLARLARALRFVLVVAASRCNDATTIRAVFLVLRLLALRSRVPAELAALIRDLCVMNPTFRRLFVKAHGALLLWKAIHSTSRPITEKLVSSADASGGASTSASEPKKMTLLKTSLASDRRPSLFSVARKSQAHKNRSLLEGAIWTDTSNSRFYVFFELDPHSVASELQKKLASRQFNEQAVSEWEAATKFCNCHLDGFLLRGGHSASACLSTPVDGSSRCHSTSELPVKMLVFEVIVHLGKHLLLQPVDSNMWDRDVAMMIRCEKLHDSLAEEICFTSQRLVETRAAGNLSNVFRCRRSVAIECVSTLFELERKRRRGMATALGDKKYFLFVVAMQTKLRKTNERLASGDSGVEHVLDAHVAALRWIPADFLEEWLMFSLGAVFETVAALHEALERAPDVGKRALILLIGRLMSLFQVLLERVTNGDLQMLLVRLLDRGFEPVVPLLRAAIMEQIPPDYAVQHQVLGFLNAFAVMNRSLPVRNEWSRAHALENEKGEVDEDNEEMEQRRSELLQRFLVFDEKHEFYTWEFLVRLVFSSYEDLDMGSSDEMARCPNGPTLLVLEQTSLQVEDDVSEADAFFFPAIEAALVLQRTLYASLSPEYNVEVDLTHAVAKHVISINECVRRVDGMVRCQVSAHLTRVVELHLDCLIALINRRCIIPEIQAALDANKVLSAIVKHLPWSKAESNQLGITASMSVQDPHIPELHNSSREEPPPTSSFGPVPQLRLNFGTGNSVVGDAVPLLKLGESTASGSILIGDDKLHALVIVLLVSYMLLEPSHELDGAFCSRYVPTINQSGAEPNDDKSDLLWHLQHHLASAPHIDVSHFGRIMFDMETTQSFVSASRATATRNVLRLLCPNLFDHTLYAQRECVYSARRSEAELQGDDGSRRRSMRSPRQEYIAKGATAIVYRSASPLPGANSVAVKRTDYNPNEDQCVVGAVYNEVSILKKLRGERAALQLVDFGNHHDDKSYEIVTEWCPCTLSEWRSSFSRIGHPAAESPDEGQECVAAANLPSAVPFRACVLMILRCFRKVCVCLARIHARGVCHFDIKGVNLFLRTSASDFTYRLLVHGEKQEHDEAESAPLMGCVCFGDFGESMAAGADPKPLHTCLSFISGAPTAATPTSSPVKKKAANRLFLLDRTRGTEAIKSPEVFRIRGNEASKTPVTFASDIWSIGCLLYELAAQELLFENDDWPALYAHLLASPDGSNVLRKDHTQKINVALAPSDEGEQRVVNQIVELCAFILDRQPQRRPTLDEIVRRVTALIHDVLKLPVTFEEKEFAKQASRMRAHPAVTEGSHDEAASRGVSGLPSFHSIRPPWALEGSKGERGMLMAAPRLFWNFFIVGTLPHCPRSSSDGLSVDLRACKEFEAAHEHEFAHFVFFSWRVNPQDESPCWFQDSNGSDSSVISRIFEAGRRTVIQIHPRLRPMNQTAFKVGGGCAASQLATQMLQGLVQHAPTLFPALQRRLRSEPGRVAFACVPSDAQGNEDGGDANALEDVMASTLLFFLERSTAVSPLEALAAFARDCCPRFLAYPRLAFVRQLTLFSQRQQQARRRVIVAAAGVLEEHKKRVVACLCGASVVTLQVSALRHALATQRCSCASSSGSCASFHPFPARGGERDDQGDADDDALGEMKDGLMPSAFVHDPWEQQLVLPMEKLEAAVQWVVVDRQAVGRLASLLDGPHLSAAPSVPPVAASGLRRRTSLSLDALKRLAGKDKDRESPRPSTTATSSHDDLLRGLRARESPHGRLQAPAAFSDATATAGVWTLLECALCRLPMCAVASQTPSDRVAVPVLPDARDASTPLLLP